MTYRPTLAPQPSEQHARRPPLNGHAPPFTRLYAAAVPQRGIDLYRAACGMDLEGIVAKLAQGPYRPAATSWVKIKNPGYQPGRRAVRIVRAAPERCCGAMTVEPDLTCPKCGNTMELIAADEDSSMMRVCPNCATLAWNREDGGVEICEGQKVTGEEKRKLLENAEFTTVEDELARLRRLRKPATSTITERAQRKW